MGRIILYYKLFMFKGNFNCRRVKMSVLDEMFFFDGNLNDPDGNNGRSG